MGRNDERTEREHEWAQYFRGEADCESVIERARLEREAELARPWVPAESVAPAFAPEPLPGRNSL